jgi:DNA-binding beta-propeller fold protein YncE
VAGSNHAWVANANGNTVTEISTSTGALTRIIHGTLYDRDYPDAIALDAKHVWVANYGQTPDFGGCCVALSSVAEFKAPSGTVLKVRAPANKFEAPSAIAVAAGHVWVANASDINGGGGDFLTELNASTSAFVGILNAKAYDFNSPSSIASAGPNLWVANFVGNTVTELSAATGALVRVITGSNYGFDGPAAIGSDGTHLWVANKNGNSVTEFPTS